MPSNYGAIRAGTQHALIEFLRAELNIGATFVQSALLAYSEGHLDHYAQGKQNAVKVAASVRKFMDRITDGQTRTEIQDRITELDRLISTL
jgi:hypothetical protein